MCVEKGREQKEKCTVRKEGKGQCSVGEVEKSAEKGRNGMVLCVRAEGMGMEGVGGGGGNPETWSSTTN